MIGYRLVRWENYNDFAIFMDFATNNGFNGSVFTDVVLYGEIM